jgi:diacylglycerol O-acyltransferase / wax synthase
MDRLSPQDASFLHVEDDVNHMHIGSVGVFEGPPPAYQEMCELFQGKLALVPRYRQRVRTVPFELGRPVWVDDPHFNLTYHLRHTALPSPGSREQLRNLASRVMSQQLDRTKPLWEVWIVEGLEDGHWALLSKIHHSMVDGVAGTDLLAVLLDLEPEPSPPIPDQWQPQQPPSGLRLVGEALTDYVASPYEQWRAARSAVLRPKRLARSLLDTGKGVASLTALARPTHSSSLTGPIGPHRRWGWATASLEDVKTIKGTFGGTVNDVVLAAITNGFRELLMAHGEDPRQQTIRSLVPVSVRKESEKGAVNNKVSAMFATLPVHLDDPVNRLHAVRSQMEDLKESKQAVAAESLVSMSGFAPPLLLALGTRAALRAAGRWKGSSVNTVTTNVPGPQIPLYARGRRLLEAYPYVPLAAPVRAGVAIFSYIGRLTFGLTTDYDSIADIGPLARGIETGVDEMRKAAEKEG